MSLESVQSLLDGLCSCKVMLGSPVLPWFSSSSSPSAAGSSSSFRSSLSTVDPPSSPFLLSIVGSPSSSSSSPLSTAGSSSWMSRPTSRSAKHDATRSAHRPRQLNKCGSGAVGRRTKRLNVGGILILLRIVRAELALLHLWRARRGPVQRPARRFFYVRVDGRSWRASVEASCMCRLHGLVALREYY